MKYKIITASILCVLLNSCDKKVAEESTENITPVATEEKEPTCCHAEAPKAVAASEDSIYQLESKWKNAQGKEQPLSSLGGRVQVLTMGYSTCKFACPKLLADMLLIKSKLPESIRDKVGFTFVSIDPEVDTPARLSEYRKENNLSEAQWTLLTADSASVQELAVVLGVKYRKTTKIDYAHSNVIVVLNEKGEILYRQEGLNGDPTETVKTIIKAQESL